MPAEESSPHFIHGDFLATTVATRAAVTLAACSATRTASDNRRAAPVANADQPPITLNIK